MPTPFRMLILTAALSAGAFLAAPASAACSNAEACAEATAMAQTMQNVRSQSNEQVEFTSVTAIDEAVVIDLVLKVANLPSDQAGRDALGQTLQQALTQQMCALEDTPKLFTVGGKLRLRGKNTAGELLFDITSSAC